MDLGLTDKVAIVTGGSEGIGRAAAQRLFDEGARVVIVGRREVVLRQAADRIDAKRSGRVLAVPGDVAAPDTAAHIVARTLERFGRIDILVNNAGTSAAKAFDAVDDAAWEADFELKFWAAVRLIRGVLPTMRKQGGGRIVNVTNLAGRTPGAASMPTSVSRAAGIALTKALSKDLAAENILVNTVCIGLIKSGQHERRFTREAAPGSNVDLEQRYAEVAKRSAIPLGRIGEAEEAGDVIAFLASARASYLTGIAINIDGGISAVV
ncbi:MAG: SDR family NAD(P)-dependent oxidoreductase [Alphaproteobacteria bacterium]|nr:SDR family NAD(P)-dependent oxidoreductase [Alphaproteobacteria bacterium]